MVQIYLPVYISFRGKPLLNPENVALLKKIQTTGSLNMAAKAMNISYQNAWSVIDQINKSAISPLVLKQRGGNGGGGAFLSEYGNLILKEYSYIEQQVSKFTQQINTEIHL